MTSNEPVNLPLDFGVPDEVVFAAAVERKDYETMGRLYDQGMPLNDPGFALQDFLLELEDGLELSDAAIKGFSMRIYKTLAMTSLDDDPLTQNAIYQLFKNVMLEDPGMSDTSTRLAAALAQLPYTKADKDTLRGTMMEAAVDILDNIDAALEDQMVFAKRFADVYPGVNAANGFAAYSCNRIFSGESITTDSTVGLVGILIHPAPAADALKAAMTKQIGVDDSGRAALLVLRKAVDSLTGSNRVSLKMTLEAMQHGGFDLSLVTAAVTDSEEFMILTRDLEFERSLFKPQAMKPHMKDHLLGSDLGL